MSPNKLYFGFFFLLFFAACSSNKNYHFGLYTQRTYGEIKSNRPDPPKEILLLVLQYQKTFVKTFKGYPERATAKVIRLNRENRFDVELPFDFHRQKIYFVSRNYKMDIVETIRTLGVGSEEQNIMLEFDPEWDNSFTFGVKPFLIDFIEKYQTVISGGDADFLYRWLEKNEDEIFQNSYKDLPS